MIAATLEEEFSLGAQEGVTIQHIRKGIQTTGQRQIYHAWSGVWEDDPKVQLSRYYDLLANLCVS